MRKPTMTSSTEEVAFQGSVCALDDCGMCGPARAKVSQYFDGFDRDT